MRINTIYIQNKLKEPIGTVSGVLELRGSQNISLSQDGVVLTISSSAITNVFYNAYAEVVGSPYISKINSVSPASDGSFFILPSMCTDITELPSGISVIDHCVPCKTCDTVIRTKKLLEYYAIWISAMKDAQFEYTNTVSARMLILQQLRLAIPGSCDEAFSEEDEKYISAIDMPGIKLLFQYAAMVHLWNYAVMINNSSTQISDAPEDTAGFVIQTRRAIPSCSGRVSCKCQMLVSQSSGQADISVYVHTPSVEFKPKGFENEGINNGLAVVTHTGRMAKKINVDFGTIDVAGVYMITAKILPFFAVTLRDSKGNIITGIDFVWSDPTEAESEEESDVTNTGLTQDGQSSGSNIYLAPTTSTTTSYCSTEITLITAPTLLQYNTSKVYPSVSTDTKNTWDIEVTWTMTQQDEAGNTSEKVYTENFIYIGNCVREPAQNILLEEEYGNRLISLINARKELSGG